MKIRRAKREDLAAINELMSRYGFKMTVHPEHINHRDISLILRHEDGPCLAFLYMGLMAQNRVGYLDKFTVHPEYTQKGLGHMMAKECYREAKKRGVKEVFGVITQDEWHDKSAINALKMAFAAKAKPFTYVEAQLAHMAKELGV